MKSILSRLSAPLLDSLFGKPADQTVRSVPVKQPLEPSTNLKVDKIQPKPKLEPIDKTVLKSEAPSVDKNLAPLKVAKSRPKPPDDFAEHMKMLSKWKLCETYLIDPSPSWPLSCKLPDYIFLQLIRDHFFILYFLIIRHFKSAVQQHTYVK